MSDLFKTESDQTQEIKEQQVDQPSSNPLEAMLKEIKNEEGLQKYATLEDALKGLKHSQEFIPALKSELQTTKQELERLASMKEEQETLEQAIERLAKKEEPAQHQTQEPSFNPEDIEQLVMSTLQRKEVETTYQANMNTVQEALLAQYGEKALDVVKAKAESLGTTPEELGVLSQKNPKMVLALFNATPKTTTTTTSSVNLQPEFRMREAEIERPSKRLISGGATNTDVLSHWKNIEKSVHAKYNLS